LLKVINEFTPLAILIPLLFIKISFPSSTASSGFSVGSISVTSSKTKYVQLSESDMPAQNALRL